MRRRTVVAVSAVAAVALVVGATAALAGDGATVQVEQVSIPGTAENGTPVTLDVTVSPAGGEGSARRYRR